MKVGLTPNALLALPANAFHLADFVPANTLHPLHLPLATTFVRPLFNLLKAAIHPNEVWMNNNHRDHGWDSLIFTRKWNILPPLTAVVRYLSAYEVAHRDPAGVVDRQLRVLKVSPLPNRNIPSTSTYILLHLVMVSYDYWALRNLILVPTALSTRPFVRFNMPANHTFTCQQTLDGEFRNECFGALLNLSKLKMIGPINAKGVYFLFF
jgi:hypothetical protein